PVWQHADDRPRCVVEGYRAADDVSPRAEARLPRLVAEQRDVSTADHIFAGQEFAAEERLHAEDVEQPWAHTNSGQQLRFAVAPNNHRRTGPETEPGEGRLLLPPRDVVAVVERDPLGHRGENWIVPPLRIRL